MVRLALCLALVAGPLTGEGLSPSAAISLSPSSALRLSPVAALGGTAQALSPAAGAVSATAQPLSASANAELPALPPAPLPPLKTENSAWESFAGVTLLSAPFTALWSVLGALAVEGFAQGQFPPDFGRDRAKATLSTAAAVAGGGSLLIGLVSVQWGGSKASGLSPTAQASPAPLTLTPSRTLP
jgi:hypothetical protein